MTAPLPPRAAIARAVALLEARGFAVEAVNGRGDAVYLRPAGGASTLRVSNHPRTARQRLRHPEVAASLVIRAPLTPERLAGRVEAALRDYGAAGSGATGSGPVGSGPRK